MIDLLVVILTIVGLFFFLATTIGILRFPDFYTRMHAAGKGDTLSSLLMLIGLALHQFQHFSTENVLVAIKIIFISIFLFFTSPTATHAIVDARYEVGGKIWTRDTARKKSGKTDETFIEKEVE